MNSYDYIGHAKNHVRDCYFKYNPTIGCMTETKDIMGLHHMYYRKPEARDNVVVHPQISLPF